ncbi:MAG: DUF2254 family protein [Methanoregula sp.]|jgi:hypothetical protein
MKVEDIPSISRFKKDKPWSYLWVYRFFQYFGLFVIVVIIGKFIISGYNVVPTDIDSAKYFLSSMVQAQAAIVSLVITLTLIAIQMTAGSYAPRVVDAMKKNPDMWFLLVIYISSISFGFVALKLIDLWDLASFVLILGIYTFLILFLYIYYTINLLRPEGVVKMLVDEINAGNIERKEETDDVIQPVFDVVYASINRFDITTTRVGLNQLEERVIELLRTSEDIHRYTIVNNFCEYIERSAAVAFRNDDEGTIIEIMMVLEKLGDQVADLGPVDDDLGLVDAAQRVAMTLRKIGVRAADREFERTTILMPQALRYVGIHAALSGLEMGTIEAVRAIKDISIHAIDRGIELTILVVPGLLDEVSTYAVNNGLERAAVHVSGVLEEIGIHAADKRLEDMTIQVTLALNTIGAHAADKGMENATLNVVGALYWVGMRASENGLDNATVKVIDAIKEVDVHAVNNKLEKVTSNVEEILKSFGKK